MKIYRFSSLILVFVYFVADVDGYNCEDSEPDARLEFSHPPGRLALTCQNEYVEVHCCMQGYTRITWFFYRVFTGDDAPFSWNPDFIQPGSNLVKMDPNERNQTIVFIRPQLDLHNGTYMCIGEDETGDTLNTTVSLVIYEDCGFNWNRRPLLLEPENENLWTDIGDSAELRCTGFYGDLHDCGVWCSIDWMRQTNGSHYEGIYNTDTSHNVYVQDVEMVSSISRMGQIVHIQNVTRDDLGLYVCTLKNKVDGETSRNVYLRERHMPEPLEAATGVLAIILSIVLLLLLVLTLIWFLRTDIRLCIKDTRKLPPDDRKYDVLIMYDENCEEDETFALETLASNLRNLNYKVFTVYDIAFGQASFSALLEAADVSRILLLLVTPDFLASNLCSQFFSHVIDTNYRRLVYVTRRQMKNDAWNDAPLDIHTAYRVGRKVAWSGGSGSAYMTSLKEKRFWRNLRLHLPPLPTAPSAGTAPEEEDKRLTI